jgi:hypothetical protein
MNYDFRNMTGWNTDFIKFVLDKTLSWTREDLGENFEAIYNNANQMNKPIWIGYNQRSASWQGSMVYTNPVLYRSSYLIRLPRPSALLPENALEALVVGQGSDELTEQTRLHLAYGIARLGVFLHCGKVCARGSGKWHGFLYGGSPHQEFSQLPPFLHDQKKDPEITREFRRLNHDRQISRVEYYKRQAEREVEYFQGRLKVYDQKLSELKKKEI